MRDRMDIVTFGKVMAPRLKCVVVAEQIRSPHHATKWIVKSAETFGIDWRAMMAAVLLMSATSVAHAVDVTTFGFGLQRCEAYLADREKQNTDEVAFIEWLGGYVSGVNATSTHTNNILGDSNLKGTVHELGTYCRAHPSMTVAVALYVFVMHWSSTTAREGDAAAIYGAGFKSCRTYLDSRMSQNADQMGFVDWLGGYLSGVNAISLNTTNILEGSDLTSTISWLDDYCRENPGTRFASAVDARVAPKPRDHLAIVNPGRIESH